MANSKSAEKRARQAIKRRASNVTQRSRVRGAVRKVVTFEGKGGHGGWVITLRELEELGRTYDREHPKRFDEVEPGIIKVA